MTFPFNLVLMTGSKETENIMKAIILTTLALLLFPFTSAQIWVPDLSNGLYKNPIIFADYSDPDVIRVEDDFYMVASSFNAMPGIRRRLRKQIQVMATWRLGNVL